MKMKDMKDIKILVVDDDFVGRKKIEATLKRHGTCTSASDGDLALDLFHKAHTWGRPFDLITMDIEMPGLNGLDMIEAIRKWEEENLDEDELVDTNVKIIVISGHSESDSILSAFKFGCESFITKPTTPGKLKTALQELGL